MIVNPMIDIIAISAVLSVSSKILQAKFIDKDKMKAQQAGMKEKQKKMQELMKQNDPKSKNELEAMEKEMMETMNKMMSGSMKVMMFSMALFLPAFFIMGFLYEEAVINLPIPIPWLAEGFDLFNIGTWGISMYNETNWFGWYFVAYLAITIIIGLGQKILKSIEQAGVVNG